DELKATPGGADSGLVIKDNDIISDFSGLTTTEGEIIRPSFGELYGMLDSKVLETVFLFTGEAVQSFLKEVLVSRPVQL
ncbi:MAG TPA: hypothetical protein PKI82_04575, partial [Ruminococcus flavefaciens]|nr:hypothetical protein [Ruminococcus flavefaciens]